MCFQCFATCRDISFVIIILVQIEHHMGLWAGLAQDVGIDFGRTCSVTTGSHYSVNVMNRQFGQGLRFMMKTLQFNFCCLIFEYPC